MMIPNELKMENLSGLEKLLPILMLNLVFGQGDRDISLSTKLNRRLYVRLLDKTIDEYNEARESIIKQIAEGQRNSEEMIEDGRQIYMFKFIDHMENCISSVRRLLRFLDNLKRNMDGLILSRKVRKNIESLTSTSSIVDLRNTLEHMDEQIQKDFIQENEPVMLRISDTQDGLIIASHAMKFSNLTTLIKKLHELGLSMAGWRKTEKI